jgi:hypothetical protein
VHIVHRFSAFVCQGAGTAIGELPPYFMARASRLSGEVDPEEQDIESLAQERQHNSSDLVIFCSSGVLYCYTVYFVFTLPTDFC